MKPASSSRTSPKRVWNPARSRHRCPVLANRSAQHGIAGFERIENRALRDLTRDFEGHFAVNVGELAQMCWQYDSYHDLLLSYNNNSVSRERSKCPFQQGRSQRKCRTRRLGATLRTLQGANAAGSHFQRSLHGSVWTSTESTAGRSRTIGVQLSPASADAYTCPPVVPK